MQTLDEDLMALGLGHWHGYQREVIKFVVSDCLHFCRDGELGKGIAYSFC